jgi:hypothetical protein
MEVEVEEKEAFLLVEAAAVATAAATAAATAEDKEGGLDKILLINVTAASVFKSMARTGSI